MRAFLNSIGSAGVCSLYVFTAAGLLAVAAPAHAERPMVVDHAGTLDRGDAELEFGWGRDDEAKGFDGAVSFGLLENVAVEVSYGHLRDRSKAPDRHERGVEASLKWIPWQAPAGLSAGVKLEYGRVRSDFDGEGRETVRASGATALASWAFESGRRLHVNLGREWERTGHDTEAANTWGTGVEQPLGGGLTVTAEVFGAEHSRPDKQLGLRYEIADGLALSGAVGRGNDRGFANAGVAWEF